MNKAQFGLLLLLHFLPWTVHSQTTLGERMAAGGTDWIIGDWEGKTAEGEIVNQSFSWDLDKHVVVSHTQNPRWEIKGTSGWNPDSGHVVYVGFSNRGGAIKGTWGTHDGLPLLKLHAVGQDGRSWKGGVVYEKKDASTMVVHVHGLDEDGELNASPASSITYKKK